MSIETSIAALTTAPDSITIDLLNEQIVVAEGQIDDLKAKAADLKVAIRNSEAMLPKSVGTVLDAVKAELETLRLRLRTIETDIRSKQQAIKDLKAGLKDQSKAENTAELTAAIGNYLSEIPSMGYIIADDEFTWIEDQSTSLTQQNVVVYRMQRRRMLNHLAKELRLKTATVLENEVLDIFNEAGRSYDTLRFSCNPARWKSNTYRPFDYMRDFFIDRLEVEGEHHEAFDLLMTSLSGGKRENQNHLEQWILHKLINWNAPTSTPDVVIVGHVGGNGKGILIKMMKMILPSCLVGRANNKTMTGGFNAAMVGKLLVIFDDQSSDDTPFDVIKEQSGADEMLFEMKGKDQYEGEKTHSSAFFSNVLPFELSKDGDIGGVDRRFSIMRTSMTFLEAIRAKNPEMTVPELKEAANYLINEVLWNRVEIAKWINHLKAKHPQIYPGSTLLALHGADYEYFQLQGLDIYDLIVRKIIKPAAAAGMVVPYSAIQAVLLANGIDAEPRYFVAALKKRIELAGLDFLNTPQKVVTVHNVGGGLVKLAGKTSCFAPSKDFVNEFDYSLISDRPWLPLNTAEISIADGCCTVMTGTTA